MAAMKKLPPATNYHQSFCGPVPFSPTSQALASLLPNATAFNWLLEKLMNAW